MRETAVESHPFRKVREKDGAPSSIQVIAMASGPARHTCRMWFGNAKRFDESRTALALATVFVL